MRPPSPRHRPPALAMARALLLLAPWLLTACEPSEPATRVQVELHPDDGQPIQALTDNALTAACQALDAVTLEALTRPAARCATLAMLAGALGEDGADTCQAAFDACIADPEAALEGLSVERGPQTEPCLLRRVPPNCSATVAELEACASERLTDYTRLTERFQCGPALADLDAGHALMRSDGPACAAVEAQCPGFITPSCLAAPPPVDLLFIIDDSGSRACDEQLAVGSAFAAFDTALAGLDWRVAVTSTDMHPDNPARGAFGTPALPAPPLCQGPDGPFGLDIDGCDESQPAVLDMPALDPAERAERFRCSMIRGTGGDLVEQPLAALAHALDCAGPNAELLGPCGAEAPAFLRPGAALVVVFITMEDDCSHADADRLPLEMPACEPDSPTPCRFDRHQSVCEWFPDALDPVTAYVERLAQAHPHGVGTTVIALAGPRFEPIDLEPVRFEPGIPRGVCSDGDAAIVSPECCPDGRCIGRAPSVCEGPLGIAFAGDRLRAFTEWWPGACASECAHLCDPDPIAQLPRLIVDQLTAATPPPCR